MRSMADDAVGLLDALEIEWAHIVGKSMGGMIAQLVASEHPHRTLSLTSIMSSMGNPGLPPATPEAMAVLARRAPHPLEDAEGFLPHSIALSREIGSPGYPFDEAAQRAQALAEVKRARNPAGFGRQIAAIAATGDRRLRLNTIVAPTLVVHGAADNLVPVAAGQDTAANIKGAELRVIEGMGHDVPPELYETLAQAIAGNARRARQPAWHNKRQWERIRTHVPSAIVAIQQASEFHVQRISRIGCCVSGSIGTSPLDRRVERAPLSPPARLLNVT
jgi:pimeloyl-ACP methyl ester carboxylesterase